MIELAIDLETYSETDIKCGIAKYVEDPNFEILLCAYKLDKVELLDLQDTKTFCEMLLDPNILKTAYNAAFEIACLNRHFGLKLDPAQWSCTQALAAQAGLPFGLDNVAKALGTIQQKDKIGKELIKFFCMPCKPTNANGMRTRNLPQHDMAKWFDFQDYCMQDVETEQDVRKHLEWFTVSNFEAPVWALDQKINNRGVAVDLELVENAIYIDKVLNTRLISEMTELTGILNPKSNAQVKQFILDSVGLEIESLNKAAMPEVMKQLGGTEMEHVLKIREKLSRTSIKKFSAILNSACADGRVRGLFQYYGANRTGRFAGRNVQLQNLKRNDLDDLDLARQLVKKNNLDAVSLMYDDVGLVLSNLIRTAFVPEGSKDLAASDLSAIEARIIAWLANEKWRLDVFATHGKIYEASASMMFGIPLDQVTKAHRQKGKVAELALGYQGALGALERMGGASMGLTTDEMTRLVKLWRKANPKIVKLWYSLQDAFVEAIQGGTVKVGLLKFYKKSSNVIIELPSGRTLVYLSAKYVNDKITYMGMDQTSKRWCMQDTYGGKIAENVVQAIARDVLVDAMLRADKAGFDIIMHVHDEIVAEIERPEQAAELNAIMKAPIDWAPGLLLNAETFTAKYYQK